MSNVSNLFKGQFYTKELCFRNANYYIALWFLYPSLQSLSGLLPAATV